MAIVALPSLPPRVLRSILRLAPELLPLFLYRLGSLNLHRLAAAIVYDKLFLNHLSPLSLQSGPIASLLSRPAYYSSFVSSLNVLPPAGHIHSLAPSDPLLDPCQDSLVHSAPSSLPVIEWDAALLGLIRNLPGLKCFEWFSDRLPSAGLCSRLGLHCPALETFSLSLHPHPSSPSSPSRCRRHSGVPDDVDLQLDHDLVQSSSLKRLRWDSDGLQALPPSLSQLSLSSLSLNGVRNLSKALESLTWPALTQLKLSKTLFFDDELIRSIVIGCKKLKSLHVESMTGTKFTDRGLVELLNGVDSLEEVDLVDVHGRFSKNGWLKLDDLPQGLKSIKFKYHENGSYHSWTLDHLEHVFSLLSLHPQSLECLSIQRYVPTLALLPGRHDYYPELGVSPRTLARKMTKDQVLQIVENGQQLKDLVIDWWLISMEGLEVIVRGMPNLINLRVLVDAPFHRLISSTAFVHSKIKTLIVSIPPEHTPFLSDIGSRVTGSVRQTGGPMSPGVNTSPPGQHSSPISTRDLKKFVKRAGQLREIEWTGRGGIGKWRFLRNCGSAVNVKVDFAPVEEELLGPGRPLGELGHEVMMQGLQSEPQRQERTGRPRVGSCVSAGQTSRTPHQQHQEGVPREPRRRSVPIGQDRGMDEYDSSWNSSSMSSSSGFDTSWSSASLAGIQSPASGHHPYQPCTRKNHHQLGTAVKVMSLLEQIPGTPCNETDQHHDKLVDSCRCPQQEHDTLAISRNLSSSTARGDHHHLSNGKLDAQTHPDQWAQSLTERVHRICLE